jgi:hypothetical protein
MMRIHHKIAVTVAVAILQGGLISACSSTAVQPATSSAPSSPLASETTTPAPTPTATSTPTPSTSKPPGVPAVVQADETSNATTLHVPVGGTVRLTLHSTYWQLEAPTTATLVAGPTTTALAPGVPGSGAGTLTTDYLATAPGTAIVLAHRTTCGEALQCAPAQRAFTITVVVGGA